MYTYLPIPVRVGVGYRGYEYENNFNYINSEYKMFVYVENKGPSVMYPNKNLCNEYKTAKKTKIKYTMNDLANYHKFYKYYIINRSIIIVDFNVTKMFVSFLV